MRNVGSECSDMKTFTLQDGIQLMWGMLQSHVLVKYFIIHKFQGYPKLAGYSISNLFRNRVTPAAMATAKGDVAKMKVDVQSIQASVTKLQKKDT